MHDQQQPSAPSSLSGYVEALARVVFSTGISWRVVDAKWPGIREAYDGFDPAEVAGMGDEGIDRLMGDTRVIRNRKKLEAMRSNTAHMLELEAAHGGFARYLDSLGDYEASRRALKKEFAFLGDSGVWLFLWMVGREVPPHDWQGHSG
jgi:3-methyladenine DNA glycosylase Tag